MVDFRMKRILIYEEKVTGHHLEYLHHLYTRAIQEDNIEFVFVLPEQFCELKKNFTWPAAQNVIVHILPENEISYIQKGRLKSALCGSKKIRSLVKKFHVDAVFSIYIDKYMPLLPFFIPHRVKLLGIIYDIYIYGWKDYSLIKKLQALLFHCLYSKLSCFEKIFVLNDPVSAVYLNKIWQSDHYTFLPDPYSGVTDLIPSAERNDEKLTLLHFGGLVKRKGTLEILRALEMLPPHELKKIRVIFCGYVRDEIKNEFYRLVNLLEDKLDIEIYDYFVSYDFIEQMCARSDYILIPYENTGQSSGVLAYAAKYSIPVIGPANGMLGKIIRRYHLGICLSSVKACSLKNTFMNADFFIRRKIKNSYLSVNNVPNFQQHIFTWIKKL